MTSVPSGEGELNDNTSPSTERQLAIEKEKERIKKHAAERRQKKGSNIPPPAPNHIFIPGVAGLGGRFAKSESALPGMSGAEAEKDKPMVVRNAVSTGYVKDLAEGRDPISDTVLSIIHNAAYRAFFQKFLKELEKSEENLMFFLEAEKYKNSQSMEERVDLLTSLVPDYIKLGAKKGQINVHSHVRIRIETTMEKLENGELDDLPPTLLDEAQYYVFFHLRDNSFPNFRNSIYYKQMQQMEDAMLAPTPTSTPRDRLVCSSSKSPRNNFSSPTSTSSSSSSPRNPTSSYSKSPRNQTISSPPSPPSQSLVSSSSTTYSSPAPPAPPSIPLGTSKSCNSLLGGLLVNTMPAAVADQQLNMSASNVEDGKKKAKFSLFSKFRNKKDS
jgi:hypothetical protein